MVVSTMVCGCALFSPKKSSLTSLGLKKPAIEATSDPNAPVKRIVRLQAATIRSRPSEARLRNLVWETLDESGAMKPEDRLRLNQSGLRVGVSGGTLPWALTSLLPQSSSSNGNQQGFGTGLVILEGNQSRIELPVKEEQISVPPNQLAGLLNGGELKNAGCAFVVEPQEYADGWVVLKVTPELRYGDVASRFSFLDDGGQYETGQKHHPLYEQQFEIKLHVGESIVIGFQENEGWTVGKLLMQSEELTNTFENLVVLQLNAVECVKGKTSMMVDHRETMF